MFAQHIALPAQIFAKIVPSIDASNIPTLGTPHFHLIFLAVRVVLFPFPHPVVNFHTTVQLSHFIGPIILILAVYQLYGFCLAFFIKQLFWVPHRFRHGIYVAAGWGNYGEIRMLVFSAYDGPSHLHCP